jgi:hypothetical protein
MLTGAAAICQTHSFVIPALVAGIQRAARSSVRGWMDSGHKARNDEVESKSPVLKTL